MGVESRPNCSKRKKADMDRSLACPAPLAVPRKGLQGERAVTQALSAHDGSVPDPGKADVVGGRSPMKRHHKLKSS